MEHFNVSFTARPFNEDRAYSCEEFAFVLDGAGALVKEKYSNMNSDAEWCSNWWYEYLKEELKDKTRTIPEILKAGVEKSVKEFEAMANGEPILDFPCTTVSVVRRLNGRLEMYALADSPILIKAKCGICIVFEDSLNTVNEGFNVIRIKNIDLQEEGTFIEVKNRHRDIICQNMHIKNKFGGYYVLANSVEAVDHGVYNSIEEELIEKVMIVSDGFAQVYDVVKFVTVEELLEAVNNIEDAEWMYNKLLSYQMSDPGGDKYIRLKLSDDSSMAFLMNN